MAYGQSDFDNQHFSQSCVAWREGPPKISLDVYIPKFHRCWEILIRTCIIIDFFFYDEPHIAIKSKISSVGTLSHRFFQWKERP